MNEDRGIIQDVLLYLVESGSQFKSLTTEDGGVVTAPIVDDDSPCKF